MGRKLSWSRKQEERLISLAPQVSLHELSQVFRISRDAVETKLAELGVAERRQFRWTQENIGELRRLAAEGIPRPHIAQQLGCSLWGVKKKLARLYGRPDEAERIGSRYAQMPASGTARGRQFDRMVVLAARQRVKETPRFEGAAPGVSLESGGTSGGNQHSRATA